MSETVTLSRAEHDALVRRAEDAIDRGALSRAGTGVYLPAELVDRMIAGEHPIRVFRELRGLTLEELASRSGIGRAFLSLLESRCRQPSVATLRRLADALGVDLDDLVD
jgi:ribosome-binding protein aMBF1 (putative translation factor)